MMRILVVTAALVVASAAGAPVPVFAQTASGQGQRMVESRIVSVQGNKVLLHDGTTMIIPRNVAQPTELEQGDTVRLTYEIKNGKKIATAIQFMDRPRDDRIRR